MYSHSKEGHEFFDCPHPSLSYVICATPRCGSSLLCEALCNTKLAGAPTEYFDKMLMERFLEHWNVPSEEAYIETIFKRKTSPNGVVGFKAHLAQFKRMFGLEIQPDQFPNLNFIWIKRKDTLAQAVSYCKAVQLDLWTHGGNAGKQVEPVYNFEQIKGLKERVESENRVWERYFQDQGIEPLELIYEECSTNLHSTVQDVFKFLDLKIENPFSIEPITLVKQADSVSQQWCERFRQESSAN